MHAHLRGLAALAALALALTACSDDTRPPTPDRSEPVTSPAAPVSSALPTSEPTAEAETASTFIRRWAQIEKEMQNTGDTRAYRTLSSDCEGCDSLASAIEGYYGDGGSVTWGGWTILSVRNYDPKVKNSYLVSVRSGPTTLRESRGAAPQRLTGGAKKYVIELRREGASWVVLDKDELVS